jgi:hypothetical protein
LNYLEIELWKKPKIEEFCITEKLINIKGKKPDKNLFF